MDLRLGWDLGLQADQSPEEVECAEAILADVESEVLGVLPVAGTQHETKQNGRAAEAWHASLGVRLQIGKAANRARWTRPL